MTITHFQGRARPKRRALFAFGLVFLGGLLLSSKSFAVSEIVVVAYNLENYTLTGSARTRPKTEKARNAVAKTIAEMHPDILGVCEMGTRDALEDLQARLRLEGIDLPEVELVLGPDPDRHLALLSRFPLVVRHSKIRVPYELNGVPQLVRRGFLDVTVEVDGQYHLRLLGVHLKSKLPIPEGETVVRRMEGQLLRGVIDEILNHEPDVNLLVYGDMNDTREQPVIREIVGGSGTRGALVELPAEDALGDRWTHYWKFADMYARIDYLMVSRGLVPEVVKGSARVGRSDDWKDASDHRPISVRIRPVDR